ncbi:proline-rich protein 36-like [Homarus americanus]|uniref:proline-rich protein 36-like n=1 Tax=Homarus americanus TaxID=6706 RepID=UPI001C452D56|nr:proline-rich protein 36-like [Homarus americanus]
MVRYALTLPGSPDAPGFLTPGASLAPWVPLTSQITRRHHASDVSVRLRCSRLPLAPERPDFTPLLLVRHALFCTHSRVPRPPCSSAALSLPDYSVPFGCTTLSAQCTCPKPQTSSASDAPVPTQTPMIPSRPPWYTLTLQIYLQSPRAQTFPGTPQTLRYASDADADGTRPPPFRYAGSPTGARRTSDARPRRLRLQLHLDTPGSPGRSPPWPPDTSDAPQVHPARRQFLDLVASLTPLATPVPSTLQTFPIYLSPQNTADAWFLDLPVASDLTSFPPSTPKFLSTIHSGISLRHHSYCPDLPGHDHRCRYTSGSPGAPQTGRECLSSLAPKFSEHSIQQTFLSGFSSLTQITSLIPVASSTGLHSAPPPGAQPPLVLTLQAPPALQVPPTSAPPVQASRFSHSWAASLPGLLTSLFWACSLHQTSGVPQAVPRPSCSQVPLTLPVPDLPGAPQASGAPSPPGCTSLTLGALGSGCSSDLPKVPPSAHTPDMPVPLGTHKSASGPPVLAPFSLTSSRHLRHSQITPPSGQVLGASQGTSRPQASYSLFSSLHRCLRLLPVPQTLPGNTSGPLPGPSHNLPVPQASVPQNL